MISKNNCILLGTLTKPHGTKGSVLLWFKDLKAEDIKDKGTVFVEIDGLLVPFFMEDFQKKSRDFAILKFEGINSETRVKEFAGAHVYLLKEQVKRKKKPVSGLPQLSGYRVNDLHKGFVGIAGEIAGIASNPLLQVQHEGRDFLVPFHEDIILEINDKEMVIVIEAPEGLFEL
jgi:16S rRNA processing protein RimM